MRTEATPTSNSEIIMGFTRAKCKGRIFLRFEWLDENVVSRPLKEREFTRLLIRPL